MFSRKNLPIIFILILAAGLRLAAVLNYGDFWGDEMFSFHYSQQPWLSSLQYWLWETNPPLHLLLLKFWWYIFPATEFWARLPSTLIGLAGIFGIWKLGRELFNNKVGLIAAFILSLHPYHVFISATARGYSLFVTLAIFSFLYFYKIFIKRESGRTNFLIYALLHLGLLFCHLTAGYLFFIELLWLFLNQKIAILNWFKINLAGGLIWLVWTLISLWPKLNGSLISSSWYFQTGNHPEYLYNAFENFFIGAPFPYISLPLAIGLFIFSLLTLKKQIKNFTLQKNFILILIWLVIPLFTAGLLGLWNIKFIIISLPALALLLAYLLVYLLSDIYIYFLILFIFVPPLWLLWRMLPLNDWHYADQILNSQAAAQALIIHEHPFNKFLLEKYLTKRLPTIAYGAKPGEITDFDIITQNYLMIYHPPAEIQAWLDRQKLDGYSQIWLFNRDALGIDLKTGLRQHGWRLKNAYRLRSTDYTELLEFVPAKNI